MSGSSIISAVLQHRAQIHFSFQQLSDIAPGSPIVLAVLRNCVRISFLFNGFLASCPDPLSSQQLSDIAFRSHFLSNGSPALCSDPLSFWWLSGIMSGSPIFSMVLWLCVQIPYLFDHTPASCPPYHFGGSPTLCLDPLSFL